MNQSLYAIAKAYEAKAMKLPVSKGRAIVLDAKTGKPKSKPGYMSASARIAKRKAASKPKLSRCVRGAQP